MAQHLTTGACGEEIAAGFLRHIGYDVRERNTKLGRDEIDIVAFDPEDEVLVFVEVRTRSKDSAYRPEHSINFRKRATLFRAVSKWIVAREYEGPLRVDIVYVVDGMVTAHFKEIQAPPEESLTI